MAGAMWQSIRYSWERYLFSMALAVVAFGALRWDWHTVMWEWLGQINGDETNSSTFRNFGLIFLPVVAIYLTWKRIKIAAREASTSRDNLRTARDALQHSERTLSYTVHKDEVDHLHSRYADASGRLSSDSVSARLGAIYELRILTAQDPQQLHVQTMKLLCAFVRFPPPDARLDEVPDDDPCGVTLRPDVQAAMEAIGSRTAERIKLETDADYMPDLRQANLVRLQLGEGNLSKIDMKGSCFWGADLTRADLSDAELQYTHFTSPWVVRGQDLAEITSQEGSFLGVSNAVFSSFTLLIGANLTRARMLQADLRGVNLQGANLSEAELPEATLANAVAFETNLSNSNLLVADLSDAHLTGTNMEGATLRGADLSGTNLSGSDSEDSANKRPPKGLTQDQLDEASADLDNPPKLDESSGLVWHPRPCPA